MGTGGVSGKKGERIRRALGRHLPSLSSRRTLRRALRRGLSSPCVATHFGRSRRRRLLAGPLENEHWRARNKKGHSDRRMDMSPPRPHLDHRFHSPFASGRQQHARLPESSRHRRCPSRRAPSPMSSPAPPALMEARPGRIFWCKCPLGDECGRGDRRALRRRIGRNTLSFDVLRADRGGIKCLFPIAPLGK